MAELRWGAATDTGRVRTENEDNLFAGPSLFVVADGMGGHQAGEIASQLTVDRLEAGLADEKLTISDLVTAIGQANRDIFEASINNAEQHGMGTTVTSLAVMDDPEEGEVFALANVGDSRTYLLRHDRLRQLTIDHSYVQELVAEGHISRDEARNHPRRNIVTRALGIEPAIRIDSWTLPIVRGDRFLLCSDGLVDEVHDDDITRVLVEHDDPQAAADELVRLALANGGRDNVTLVVVDVLEGRDPPDPTEELDIAPAWADEFDDTGPVPPITAGGGRPGVLADPDDPSDADLGADDTGSGSGIEAPELDPAERDADAPLLIEPDAVGDPPPPPVHTPATDPMSSTDGSGVIPARSHPETDPNDADASGGRRRLVRFVSLVTVAAVVVVTLTLIGAWARSGFFVAFDDDTVVVYRGRAGSVLWFDPTVEFRTSITRDDLDPALVGIVESERRFESLRSAESFVTGRLAPTTNATATPTVVTPTTPTTATTTTIDEAGDAGS